MLPVGFISEEQYEFPAILNICVFKGSCTANCIHCPVGRTSQEERKSKFGYEELEMPLFMKIVDEVAEYPQATLRIHSVGEPLLWRTLPEALKYARDKGVRTWIFTSAVTYDKELLERVVFLCDIVEVSINSYEPNDYKKTKGLDAFKLVYDNVKYMNQVIKSNRLCTRLLTSRVESDDKEYDMNFVSFWKNSNLVADAFVRSYHSYNSLIEDKRDKRNEITACHVHWGRFNVDSNGEVVVCFNELFKGPLMDRTLVIGDLRKQTIQEIWHGDKLCKIRRSQIEKNPLLIDFTTDLPCNNCTYCQPLFSDTEKSENQIVELTNRKA